MKNIFLKNLSFLTIIQLSNSFVPLLIIPYISRIIGMENFGNLEFARVFCYYFTIFINYGFDLTITREISVNRDKPEVVNKLVNQTIYAKILLFLVSICIFGLSLEFYEAIQTIKTLLILTFLINIGYMLYPIWFFQGIEEIARISIINLVGKLFVAVLTVVLIVYPSDFWIYNFLQAIGMIGVSFYSIYLLIYRYKIKIVKPDFSAIKEILIEGFPIFFGTILVTVITTLFFVFLQSYSTDIELAKFSTANKLIATIQLVILLPFSQAFFPLINQKKKEGKKIFKNYINLAALIIFIVTLFQGIFIYLFPELIIKIVFGNDYLISVDTVRVLAFLPMFASLTNVYGYQGLLSLKKDKQFLVIHVIFASICLAINLYFISHYTSLVASYIRLGMEISLFLACLFLYQFYIKKWKN